LTDERILNCAVCEARLAIRYRNQGDIDSSFTVEREYVVLFGNYVCIDCVYAIKEGNYIPHKKGSRVIFEKTGKASWK